MPSLKPLIQASAMLQSPMDNIEAIVYVLSNRFE
jgi:hypothetical protein